MHGHTFLHSWSGPMTVVIGLLHGATFLSNLPLVLFVSFIGPWQLERTLIKPHLQLQFFFKFRIRFRINGRKQKNIQTNSEA